MKKGSAIVLVCAMLLSMLVLPISANEITATNAVGKTINIDGVKDPDEGWASTPVAYLNKIYGNGAMTESENRGEVYLSVDAEYIYIFFELYKDYNVVFDSATTQTFLKVNFGSAGEEEIGFWGTVAGRKRTNPGVKSWTTGVDHIFTGTAVNTVDGNYTVECRLPIPPSVKKSMETSSVEIKVCLAQGFAEAGGGYISDTAVAGATESTARNAANGIVVALPKIDPESVPLPKEMPAVVNVAGKTMTIDGVMGENEGWASIPYALLDTAGFGADLSDVTFDSKVYFSTDGQNLYVFFRSGAEKHGAEPLLYLNFLFAGFEKKLEIGVQMLEGKTGFWRWRCDDTAQAAYTSAAKSDAAQATVITESETTVELRIPLPEAEKNAMLNGETSIRFGIYERYDSKAGDAGVSTSEGFSWNANIPMTLPMVNAIPVVTDVYGKKMKIDGAMGSAENWSSLPYMVLGATTADGTTPSGKVSADFSNVRYSADAENIYVFFETSGMASERLYLQFAFDGKSAGANGKGYFLLATLNITPDAKNVVTALKYGDGLHYVAGDAMYDGFSVAVKQTSSKNCVEACIPIPKSVANQRLDGAVTVMVGAYEQFTADAANGYIPESGYTDVPDIELVLSKDDASVSDMLKTWIEQSRISANHANLAGLSVNVFGDSMFTGGGLKEMYTWVALLATKYDWTLNNLGEDGDMVSEYQGIDDMPMTKRYRRLPNNSPDLLIVAGGYNDWKNDVPLGESGSRDTKTYMGALGTLIDGLKAKYKDTAIVFVTPWNGSVANSISLTCTDYAKAMAAVCEQKGVYCFKAYDKTISGVDMQSADFREEYALNVNDSYHLNLEGSKLVMPRLEAFLNESVTQWFENDETEPDNDGNGTNTTPDTEAPITESTGEESGGTGEKKGCGASIAGYSGFVVIFALGFGYVCRKKKED